MLAPDKNAGHGPQPSLAYIIYLFSELASFINLPWLCPCLLGICTICHFDNCNVSKVPFYHLCGPPGTTNGEYLILSLKMFVVYLDIKLAKNKNVQRPDQNKKNKTNWAQKATCGDSFDWYKYTLMISASLKNNNDANYANLLQLDTEEHFKVFWQESRERVLPLFWWRMVFKHWTSVRQSPQKHSRPD